MWRCFWIIWSLLAACFVSVMVFGIPRCVQNARTLSYSLSLGLGTVREEVWLLFLMDKRAAVLRSHIRALVLCAWESPLSLSTRARVSPSRSALIPLPYLTRDPMLLTCLSFDEIGRGTRVSLRPGSEIPR